MDQRADRAILCESNPGKLAWLAIEPIWHAIDLAEPPAHLDAQLATLTPGQAALFAIHWCIAEVSNGGFEQFFSNPTGGLTRTAREGCVLVGNEIYASILDQVMAQFPSERPARARAERLLQLRLMRGKESSRVAAFEPYDNAFLGLLDEIEADMAAYVLEHPEEFVRVVPPAS